MKESGLNYFANDIGLNPDQWLTLYTYEQGAGTNVASISGAQSGYSGTLSSSSAFWAKPGSGFFSGTSLSISNAASGHSETWTKVFVYEQTQTGSITLFNSLVGGSGHKIGVTDSNRLFFESYNEQPIVAAGFNNLSSKNAVSVSYVANYVELNYFNFNAQEMEVEAFSYPFQVTRSDSWTLGGGAPYYADYYLHFNSFQSATVVSQLLSGLYSRPTGYAYDVTTICTTGVTGYQTVFVGQTGVTGYQITPGGDEGRDYYTGAFPTSYTTTYLTGYLSSGLAQSGVTGVT